MRGAALAVAGFMWITACSPTVSAFSPARAGVRHVRSTRIANAELKSSHTSAHLQFSSQLSMASDKYGDERPDDPNPGGLNNQWSEGNDKKSFNDLNLFEQIREWWSSDEGKEDVKTYTVSLTFALLLRFLIIEPRYIPSLSMFPTFEVGDQLAVEKVTKRIRPFNRNEVVVFNPPQRFREIVGDSSRKAKEALIKRIVAVEVRNIRTMFSLHLFQTAYFLLLDIG